jgi:hypothetical protein
MNFVHKCFEDMVDSGGHKRFFLALMSGRLRGFTFPEACPQLK